MTARRTPLYEAHRLAGAKLVEFAGWEMPLSYGAVADEHHAVRRVCGLFDVSHMGEIELRGDGARMLCQTLTVNDVNRLGDGDGQYTLFCNEQGGVIDDLIVYRLSADRYLLVVNAATTATDLAWIGKHVRDKVEIVDRSDATALVALQGPQAEWVLRAFTPVALSAMRPFTVSETTVAGRQALLSRTGYTGEDGFEIFTSAADVLPLWEALVAAVRRRGGVAAGLGARDTLRLEAGLPLYGMDMDTTTTPIEAGLGWVVKPSKGMFIGREPLVEQVAEGPARRLVAFELVDAGVPRHGCKVWVGDREVGVVTSGAKSPSLGQFIGLAYVHADVSSPGTALGIDIRGRRLAGQVVPRPFYRRPKARSDT